MSLHWSLDGLVGLLGGSFFTEMTPFASSVRLIFALGASRSLRDKLWPYYRYVHGVIVPCELDRRLLRCRGYVSLLFHPAGSAGWKYGLLLLRRVLRYREKNYPHDKSGSKCPGTKLPKIRSAKSYRDTFETG